MLQVLKPEDAIQLFENVVRFVGADISGIVVNYVGAKLIEIDKIPMYDRICGLSEINGTIILVTQSDPENLVTISTYNGTMFREFKSIIIEDTIDKIRICGDQLILLNGEIKHFQELKNIKSNNKIEHLSYIDEKGNINRNVICWNGTYFTDDDSFYKFSVIKFELCDFVFYVKWHAR